MLAHRRALLIPHLTGPDNYKEWSQKLELLLRVRKWWPVVLSPPRPVKTTPGNQENFIFVASRNRIYEQCPDSLVSAVDNPIQKYYSNTCYNVAESLC